MVFVKRLMFFAAIVICSNNALLAQDTVNKLLFAHGMTRQTGVASVVKAIIDNSSKGYEQLLSESNGVFKTRVDIVGSFIEELSDNTFAETIDLYSERNLSILDPQKKVESRIKTICKIADEYANTEWPVTKIIIDLSESLQGYEGRGRSIGSDFFVGPESNTISPELSSMLSYRVLSEDNNQNYYYKIQNLSSQVATASPDNYMLFEYILEQVALLRNNIKAAGSWTTLVEIDLTKLEDTVLKKLQDLKDKDPKYKLVDYIDDVTSEDTYTFASDPAEMSVTELTNAFIDKLAYEISSYGNVDRAVEVLTDKKAVATIISTLKGKDSSVILDTVKDVLKEKYEGSSTDIDQGLAALEAELPSLTLKAQRTVVAGTSTVKEPQSISEALSMSSNIGSLMDEFPAIFASYQNILDFIASAEALPKAKALNVLTQATAITDLVELSATEAKELQTSISSMADKIAKKDKDLLAERIRAYYTKHLLLMGDQSSNNAVIEGFKDYLLINDVSLKGDVDLCTIVAGTIDREEDDSLLAFRGKAQKDGLLFLLLLGNNSTIVFNGAELGMSNFLANDISGKTAIAAYLFEQAKAVQDVKGDLTVSRNGVDQLIKLEGTIKEKAGLLLQEMELSPLFEK